jgi:RNA polymerase sigma-70 factor, ECF subfamily
MTALVSYIYSESIEPPHHWRPWRGLRAHAVAAMPAARTAAARQSMDDAQLNLTQLLQATANGDRRNLDALMGAIYQDLRRLAVNHMQNERDDHTLQATALVHEAYLRLIDQHSTNWKDRIHFFAVASRIIRRILVDHARERLAKKRGGDQKRVPVEQVELLANSSGVDIMSLDDALTELSQIDQTQAKIVELRYFSGLTIAEVADVLAIGKRSVDREWQCAKAWLYCRLANTPFGAGDA